MEIVVIDRFLHVIIDNQQQPITDAPVSSVKLRHQYGNFQINVSREERLEHLKTDRPLCTVLCYRANHGSDYEN